jgi:hypothetical protein
MSSATQLQEDQGTATIVTTKHFTPWCDGSSLSMDGLTILHTATGVKNYYMWDEKMGSGPGGGKSTMASKRLKEWYAGDNIIQVSTNINGVAMSSGELKTDWGPYAKYQEIWVNFYLEGGRYKVKLSLDAMKNQVESTLS